MTRPMRNAMKVSNKQIVKMRDVIRTIITDMINVQADARDMEQGININTI